MNRHEVVYDRVITSIIQSGGTRQWARATCNEGDQYMSPQQLLEPTLTGSASIYVRTCMLRPHLASPSLSVYSQAITPL